MGRRPVNVLRRLYAEITPDDSTLTTRVIVRFRGVVFVIVLCLFSAVAGAEMADRTQPGICLYEQCWVKLTPLRGGDVHVRRSYPGEPVREATVPADCLRAGQDKAGPECPSWLWAPAPPVTSVGG